MKYKAKNKGYNCSGVDPQLGSAASAGKGKDKVKRAGSKGTGTKSGKPMK